MKKVKGGRGQEKTKPVKIGEKERQQKKRK
jgi:hypothetical protein